VAMLEEALRGSRPVHFIHAARHGGTHAFRRKIDELAQRHPQLKRFFCYEPKFLCYPVAKAGGAVVLTVFSVSAATIFPMM